MDYPNCRKCYHYGVCHYVDSTLPVCGVYIEREKVVAAVQAAKEEMNKGCYYCNHILKKDSCVFCKYFHLYRIGCKECDACHDATPPNALELNRVSWKSKYNYCQECGKKM